MDKIEILKMHLIIQVLSGMCQPHAVVQGIGLTPKKINYHVDLTTSPLIR